MSSGSRSDDLPPELLAGLEVRGRPTPADPEAMRALRAEVFDLVGPDFGLGILYGSGFREGMLEGLRTIRGFHGLMPAASQLSGPGIPMVFVPDAGGARLTGTVGHTAESGDALDGVEPAGQPGCALTAGFAAGWYSAVLGTSMLVREVECLARGGARCSFEARPIGEWSEEDRAWSEALLPFLDFDRIRQRADAELRELEEADPTGLFEPMTAAAHVWGPLLVLPYGGAEDAESTLAAVWEDPASERLEVAVIDVTGARIDELEAIGLVRILDRFEGAGIETILAGIQPAALALLESTSRRLTRPLVAADVPDAIALGFQICQPSGSVH